MALEALCSGNSFRKELSFQLGGMFWGQIFFFILFFKFRINAVHHPEIKLMAVLMHLLLKCSRLLLDIGHYLKSGNRFILFFVQEALIQVSKLSNKPIRSTSKIMSTQYSEFMIISTNTG